MQILYSQNATNQASLRAVRGEYDGAPTVNELLIDYAPTAPNPDRLGIASYLAFGSYISGALELPSEITPTCGNAIREDSGLASVAASPVRLRPQPLPVGSRSVRVNIDRIDITSPSALSILHSGSWNGRLRSHYTMAVGSNAFLLRRHPADIRPYLAVAVLLAEELDADELLIPSEHSVEASEQDRLQRLLDSCRLGIRWTDDAAPDRTAQD